MTSHFQQYMSHYYAKNYQHILQIFSYAQILKSKQFYHYYRISNEKIMIKNRQLLLYILNLN